MEITSAETDGDGYRVQRGRLGTDLNFTGTDGDGEKCSSPRRALLLTLVSGYTWRVTWSLNPSTKFGYGYPFLSYEF